MAVVGIICEYNPFHRGHQYQIQEIRRRLGPDTAIVCAMSGAFVQRGEPSAFHPLARARAAVAGGADLVLQLPTGACLSSAEGFASAGVELLTATGICDYLAFGAESDDMALLSGLAEFLCSGLADEKILECLQQGISYAAARQQALEALGVAGADSLSQPNNILAVEYLKALYRQKSTLRPLAIQRRGTEHDAAGCSGSSIRQRLTAGENWQEDIPKGVLTVFEDEISAGRGPVTASSLEQAVLYRLRTMTREDFAALPDAGEGLGDRLFKAVRQSSSADELLRLAKSKRYAMSRLRRMVICALLGIQRDDPLQRPAYLRVLAAGERARPLLSSMKQKSLLPVLTGSSGVKKLNQQARSCFERECRISDLYALAYPNSEQRGCGGDWSAVPVCFSRKGEGKESTP